MRRSQSIAVAGLGLCAVLAPAAPAPAHGDVPDVRATASRCSAEGSRTLLAERTLRVYRTHTFGHGEEASDLVIACWLASGRQTVLVTETPRQANNEVRLTAVKAAPGFASVIAVSSSTTGVGLVGTDLLESVNVRSGRRLASNESELLACEEGCHVGVFSFVVAPDGTLAFLGEVSGASADRPDGLYVKPVGGSIRLIEAGEPAQHEAFEQRVITDLSVTGNVLSWRSNGTAKSAPLD